MFSIMRVIMSFYLVCACFFSAYAPSIKCVSVSSSELFLTVHQTMEIFPNYVISNDLTMEIMFDQVKCSKIPT